MLISILCVFIFIAIAIGISKIPFEIGKEVKEATIKFDKDLQFLSDKGYPLCIPSFKVTEGMGESLFVKCDGYYCYKMSWGMNYYICTCPVRNEIYNLYVI